METADRARSLVWILIVGTVLVAAAGLTAWAFGLPLSAVLPTSVLTVGVVAAVSVMRRT